MGQLVPETVFEGWLGGSEFCQLAVIRAVDGLENANFRCSVPSLSDGIAWGVEGKTRECWPGSVITEFMDFGSLIGYPFGMRIS